MTDGGATFQAGTEDAEVPFRPRGTYAGYKAFGSGDGAVLLKPEVTRELRSAAEFATQERRIAGGLLYGAGWADEQGRYLVVDGYLEAGPGENRGDRIAADGTDRFTLSEADLRLLREDAGRMYPSDIEVGWWRSLATLGEFSPQDFATQGELVGPGGVGLLVYGSSPHWGTAYLGPDGLAPDSAGTLVAAVDPGGAVPGPGPVTDAAAGPDAVPDTATGAGAGPEVVDIAAGETLLGEPPLAPEPLPAGAGPTVPGPQAARRWRARPQAAAPVGTAARRWAVRRAAADGPPETPADVQLIVIALCIAFVAAAIIIGALVHSVLVAVIIAAIGLLVVLSSVWFTRR
jgi:hypothetical protein